MLASLAIGLGPIMLGVTGNGGLVGPGIRMAGSIPLAWGLAREAIAVRPDSETCVSVSAKSGES